MVGVDTITYGAVAQMMKYICDVHPVTIQVVDLTFPCPHSEILRKTEEVLERYNEEQPEEGKPRGKSAKERVKMVVVDSIASNPG
jgi:hypothetical protein